MRPLCSLYPSALGENPIKHSVAMFLKVNENICMDKPPAAYQCRYEMIIVDFICLSSSAIYEQQKSTVFSPLSDRASSGAPSNARMRQDTPRALSEATSSPCSANTRSTCSTYSIYTSTVANGSLDIPQGRICYLSAATGAGP